MSPTDPVDRSPGSLAGRVVLVTGAARGIGLAVATAFAAAGAEVEIGDLDADAAQAAASSAATEVGAPASALHGAALDVASSVSVERWFQEVVARRGRVDVLINNAGIQLNRAALDLSDADWRSVMGIDLDGAFYCSRAAGKLMVAQGSGVILNISSVAANFGMPRRVPYGVAKAALSALTRGLAAEWAPYGVRVLAIAPGYVETDLVKHAFEAGHIDRDEILAKIPAKRLAEPRSIADVAVFLASGAADYLTGQTIVVDGGFSIFK